MSELTERARKMLDDRSTASMNAAPEIVRALCEENERLSDALARICDAPVGPVTVEAVEPWRAAIDAITSAKTVLGR